MNTARIVSYTPMISFLGYRGEDLTVTRETFHDLDLIRFRDRENPFIELILDRETIEDNYQTMDWWTHYAVAWITTMRHICDRAKRSAAPATP